MPALVHDPVRRQRLAFSREGDVLRVEVFADPDGDVPAQGFCEPRPRAFDHGAS
jgi:hypothetical protein